VKSVIRLKALMRAIGRLRKRSSPDTALACWLAVTPDNKWVYVTNTSSRSITSYRAAEDTSLTLVAPVGRSALR
jgi:6-phosphogluconolactonase (cycloisomerase 2 family)